MATPMSTDRREEYQQKVRAELDKINARIDEFRAKVDHAKADASAEYHSQLEQLISKRDAAQNKLQELQQSSGEAWDELQRGFENAWNELNKSFQNATSVFNR